jgi:threonine dehydrogenase-like Zn-dependent dehydrogenase
MKQAWWYGGRDIRIEDKQQRALEGHEVRVRVKAVGICGSELHAYTGASKRRTPPLLMGHEFAGEVAEMGKDACQFKVGERVAIEPLIRCGTCRPCQRGETNICVNRRLVGLHTPGAFAEYVIVPLSICHKMPNGLSFESASFAEPLANAIRAVGQTPLEVGDSLLVLGTGIIGLFVIQIARLRTGGDIIGTDLIEKKLELARRFGANHTINAMKEDVLNRTRELTHGAGVDHSIEVVGDQDTVRQAISATSQGGTVTVIGLMQQLMDLDVMEIVSKEIKLIGHYGYTGHEFATALDFIARGKVDVASLTSKTLPLERIVEGFEMMAAQTAMKCIITP